MDDFLWIKLSDGTTITPAMNTSTSVNPIKLPNDGDNFANVGMLVPISTDSIALTDLIGAPNNYWGDDDGDGQGINGITATGNLSVRITDKNNQAVSRSATLDICQSPYKVELTGTSGSLTTQYGVPNTYSFSGSTAIYYISPKGAPKICYLYTVNASDDGPADVWTPRKGFFPQSFEPSSYNRNFPTTGANKLYFDLDIGGIKGSALTWPTISQGGITATMTPSTSNLNNIRVTLTGPAATESQQSSLTPGRIATPTLPQTFVLVGKDSSNKELLSYGFVLKQWFVTRGDHSDLYPKQLSWCTNLGGYHLPHVKDLTNAVCPSDDRVCNNNGPWIGGTPPSTSGNYYNRNIGAGLVSEWGAIYSYRGAGFPPSKVWTADSIYVPSQLDTMIYTVDTYFGPVAYTISNEVITEYLICTYP